MFFHWEPGLFLNYWCYSLFSFSRIFALGTLSFLQFLLAGPLLSLRTGTCKQAGLAVTDARPSNQRRTIASFCALTEEEPGEARFCGSACHCIKGLRLFQCSVGGAFMQITVWYSSCRSRSRSPCRSPAKEALNMAAGRSIGSNYPLCITLLFLSSKGRV